MAIVASKLSWRNQRGLIISPLTPPNSGIMRFLFCPFGIRQSLNPSGVIRGLVCLGRNHRLDKTIETISNVIPGVGDRPILSLVVNGPTVSHSVHQNSNNLLTQYMPMTAR